MSRLILSPLHYLAIAALAVPFLGVGYIAGNGDMLSEYRMNLELSLSGEGSDFAGKVPDASEPIFPIIAEANDLFDIKGKGPRADLLYRQRIASTTDYEERRRRADLGLESEGSRSDGLDDTSVTSVYPSKQSVNRVAKSNRRLDDRKFAAKLKTDEDPMGMINRGKVEARLPIISQARVAGVFNLDNAPYFGERSAKHSLLGERQKQVARLDGKEKPGFTGLEVKHVASLGSGRRKFFGGLTEGEFRKREKRCLATAIYFEARSEPIKGQIAVAQVIMNRVRSRYYADTVCGVVYEGAHKRNACQFSFACDGIADKAKDKKRWVIAEKLATRVTTGKVWLADIGHASHYHANYVRPKWRRSMKRIKQIGVHIFYRAKYFTEQTKVAIR